MSIQVTLVMTHDQPFLSLRIRHLREVQIKATRCPMQTNSSIHRSCPQTKDRCFRYRCKARQRLMMNRAPLKVVQIVSQSGEWRHKWTIIAHRLLIWLWTTNVDMNYNMRAITTNTSSARVPLSIWEASAASDSIKPLLTVRLHLKMSNIKWCIHVDLRKISYLTSSRNK